MSDEKANAIQIAGVEVPLVQVAAVACWKVSLGYRNLVRHYTDETLRAAVQAMVDELSATGWPRVEIEKLAKQTGVDLEELEWP